MVFGSNLVRTLSVPGKSRIQCLRGLAIKCSFVALATCFTFFQSSLAQESNIKFEHLTVDQGLPQNSVICIYQDHKGFLWFGTLDGLAKYDGYGFTTYKHIPNDPNSLSYNAIATIYEDHAGQLWVGTDRDLNKFDPETERFEQFSFGAISAVCEDSSGTLWVGSGQNGLYRVDRERNEFVNYRHDPADPKTLSVDGLLALWLDLARGVLWIGTGSDGLDRFDIEKEAFTHYQHELENPKSLSHNAVIAVCPDGHGALWIGTYGGGLDRFDPETGEFVHFKHDPADPNSLSDDTIHALVRDEETNALWIATQHGGLNRLDLTTQVFTRFRHDPDDPKSLSNDEVWSVFRDNSATLWAGTRGDGLNKFNARQVTFKHYKHDPADPNSLVDNRVWTFYEDHAGGFWIGTDGGLSRFDRKKESFLYYAPDPHKPGWFRKHPVRAICEDGKSRVFWLATLGEGLARFDRKKQEVSYFKVANTDLSSSGAENLYALREDESRKLWIGTNGGALNILDLNEFNGAPEQKPKFVQREMYLDEPHNTGAGWVTTILEDRFGSVWLGTWENGLVEFDLDSGERNFYRHDPHNPNSLSDNSVFSIHEDARGVLWVGTNGGGLNKLVRRHVEGSDQSEIEFTRYTQKDGLPNNVIYGILEDDFGNLWLSSNRGLSRFDPRSERFINYDKKDGLQSNEFNLGAYYETKDGEMFFGGINGFNRFHPQDVINTHPPRVVLTAFKKFGRTVRLPKPINEMKKLTLSYQDVFFSFEFVALHYKNPAKNQYAYFLEGFDKEWNYIGTKREAIYTNLDPGEYRFRVKAANSDGIWNQEGVALEIIIVPPFWQTPYFYLGSFLTLVLIVVAIYKYKLGQALRIERAKTEERERIQKKVAADFHDELGHRVTKISLITKLLKRSLKSALPDFLADLDLIADNADSLYREMKEFIWELDPEKDSIYDLTAQLKTFSDQLFDKTPIAFRLTGLSPTLEQMRLPLDWRLHLLRIFKEGMNNILKHAHGCKNVALDVRVREGNLGITLTDDGEGFDMDDMSPGNGLKNMQDRAAKLQAEFTIRSSPSHGTTVQYRGKLP
ncbi:MAG: two-component regulator propeller domain-containing protein [bacterium]